MIFFKTLRAEGFGRRNLVLKHWRKRATYRSTDIRPIVRISENVRSPVDVVQPAESVGIQDVATDAGDRLV